MDDLHHPSGGHAGALASRPCLHCSGEPLPPKSMPLWSMPNSHRSCGLLVLATGSLGASLGVHRRRPTQTVKTQGSSKASRTIAEKLVVISGTLCVRVSQKIRGPVLVSGHQREGRFPCF